MTQSAEAQEVIADVPCQKCGYNLRGLSPEGRCPECGSAIWPSLSAPPQLAMAYAPWIRELRRGAARIIIGYMAFVLTPVIGVFSGDELMGVVVQLVMLSVAMGCMALGGHRFASPEPYSGSAEDAPFIRPAVRCSGWAVALTLLLVIAAHDPVLILPALAFAANQIAIILYAGLLARRIPARSLTRLSNLAAAILVACWIGMFVAGVLDWWTAIWILLLVSMVTPILCVGALLMLLPKNGRTDPKPWTSCLTGPVQHLASPTMHDGRH